MKKTLLVFMAVWISILTAPTLAETWGDYEYTPTSATTCTITNYTGPGGDIAIPDTLNGLTVTVIGESSFRKNINLTGIIIPDSIITIENYTFLHCSNLIGITLGANLAIIGDYAFSGCMGQGNIIIPDSVTDIGDRAFLDCTGLTDITIGSGVTSVGFLAFSGCTGLLTITVDALNPVYSSLDGVLFNKTKTELLLYPAAKAGDYTVPDSVISIEDYAFSDSANLTGLYIPNSVTNIANYTFYKCTSPLYIIVDPLNLFYSSIDGVLFNKEQTTLLKVPVAKSGSYAIPNTVISIESYAFNECIDLTDVIIGNSVLSIEFGAFSGCAGLTGIIIPDNVINIRSSAFRDCTSLTEVIIPDSITRIEPGTFSNCIVLTNVTIGNSVSSIGTSAFSGCTSLTEIAVDAANSTYSSLDGVLFNKDQVELILYPSMKSGSYTVPNSVTSIGAGAFFGCSDLPSITIPESVISLGYSAFFDCTDLQEIIVNTTNPAYSSLDGVLFNKAQTELLLYPLAKVGYYAIPNSVVTIDGNAFRGCTDLTCVIIPGSVITIWGYAFNNCPILTGIYFKGDAPVPFGDGPAFWNVPNAIVYYLPETAGWGMNYGGLQTALWPLSVADVDMDGDVNLWDFTVFAAAWQSSSGQPEYNSLCDLSEPFGVIDAADLSVFADAWLVTPCP